MVLGTCPMPLGLSILLPSTVVVSLVHFPSLLPFGRSLSHQCTLLVTLLARSFSTLTRSCVTVLPPQANLDPNHRGTKRSRSPDTLEDYAYGDINGKSCPDFVIQSCNTADDESIQMTRNLAREAVRRRLPEPPPTLPMINQEPSRPLQVRHHLDLLPHLNQRARLQLFSLSQHLPSRLRRRKQHPNRHSKHCPP